MIFFSYQFVFFATLFFLVYWATPWGYARRVLLLTACIVFHAHFAGPAGVLPIVVLGTGTYFVARTRDRMLCAVWIGVCTSALVFYKYIHFFLQGLLSIPFPGLAKSGEEVVSGLLPALPPLGISFFTFEFVHYLIEVQRGHRPICSPLSFALFTIFWPSLVAGPIKRYRQFIVSMSRGVRMVSRDDALAGILRVTIGIVKKFGGDLLTGWIDFQQPHFEDLSPYYRWLFVVAIGARIFLDFSGYSDMAIGFARMMGIRLPENFNWPYLAINISDFWRRWHMSLSTWIRDYIYIPLGGSRHGPMRKGFNALIAMMLCGLWHGAAWNFALWGIYHGVGLVAREAASNLQTQLLKRITWSCPAHFMNALSVIGRSLSWALTMVFVHIGWLFFFYPADKALRMTLLLFSVG